MSKTLDQMDKRIKARKIKRPYWLKLSRLIHQAQIVTKSRGHTMGRFKRSKDGASAISHCKSCKCYAQVIANPQPNQIDLGGDALALQCTN